MRSLTQGILTSRTGATHASQGVQQPPPPQQVEPAYTYKIANFTRKLAQANSNHDWGTFESETFFSRQGYEMRLSSHLNEGPNGKSGYMGIYLILMESHQDETLPWPFTKKFKVIFVDQRDDCAPRLNVERTVRQKGKNVFQSPRRCESAVMGISCFIKHSTLRTRQYIRDHAVFIKSIVDTYSVQYNISYGYVFTVAFIVPFL